jgi:hypothetical protein
VRFEQLNGVDPAFALPIPRSVAQRVAAEDWGRAHLSLSFQGDVVKVSASAWHPEWLAGAKGEAPDDSLHDPVPRRNDDPVEGDPMLRKLGLEDYQSQAQCEATRTIACAPPGSTVVINLPTASGKAFCALAPALVPMPDRSGRYGTSPVIVPTVALALDLEARIQRVLGPSPVAYRPDDPEEVKRFLRASCSAGAQGPVLVSPESANGSLRASLERAASDGLLRYFVIDEAHIVRAWGDGFRPAFQCLAGLRRDLLRRALEAGHKPFVTVLMSATLTAGHLELFREIFPPEGQAPFQHVHAVRLRPEPSYWLAHAPSVAQRTQWLLEAVRHLPRPLILYVVKRADATRWAAQLRDAGFARVGLMMGETEWDERRQLLSDWNADRIDVVVATSAFGLGVDKPNVRAVLHAALPEGVDRFYQDVGRAGRDGRASLSLMVWCASDFKTAGGLIAKKYIGVDRGFQRWQAMLQSKKLLPGGRIALETTVPPTNEKDDLDMENEENERWNVRTVLLMARAGLLDLDSAQVTDEHDEPVRGVVTVCNVDPAHATRDLWEARVERRRQGLKAEDRAARVLLERLVRMGGEGRSPGECIATILRDCYRMDGGVRVVRSCGGCPHCRAQGAPRQAGRLVAHQLPDEPFPPSSVGSQLNRLLAGGRAGLILTPSVADIEELRPRLARLASWLLDQGCVNLVAPEVVWKALAAPELGDELRANPHWMVLSHRSVPARTEICARQPTAIFVLEEIAESWPKVWEALEDRDPSSPRLVVVLPEDASEPEANRRDAGRREIRATLTCPKQSLSNWEEEYVQ